MTTLGLGAIILGQKRPGAIANLYSTATHQRVSGVFLLEQKNLKISGRLQAIIFPPVWNFVYADFNAYCIQQVLLHVASEKCDIEDRNKHKIKGLQYRYEVSRLSSNIAQWKPSKFMEKRSIISSLHLVKDEGFSGKLKAFVHKGSSSSSLFYRFIVSPL